ncbi:MAG: 16S rRNA (uracil(1498)-N(3))-methyltransferase [Bacilli bacterium]|nr:16S rRNA (uracil(1498)-N(3))-methyltransferase [Bacilli bacterium]
MQRYFVNELNNNRFILSSDDSYHVSVVMRMKIESRIEIVYNNEVYLTKIISFNPVVAEVIKKIDTYNELSKKVTICQSLVNNDKMHFILEKCTELGAYSFIPLSVTNSIIKLNDKDKVKKINHYEKIVMGASRQSKRNIVPRVYDIMNVEELIKLDFDLKILCTVNEVSRSLKNVLQNSKNYATMIIVIGPEGGFTESEEKSLIDNGFISTSLGNLVLRTETASVVSLSMINYEYER